MKIRTIIATALVAVGLAASASAQVSANIGDFVLGFNKGSGTGSTSNLEVSLGSITNFLSGGTYATGSEVLLANLGSDLNANYGTSTGSSGWKSSATTWAVVGTNGAAGGNTLWGTQVTPELPGSDQGAGANTIAAMYLGLNGKASTANLANAAVISTADTQSWKNTSSGNFSYWTNTIFRNNSALASGSVTSINLYEYVQGAPATTLLGTFKLYGTGDFSFTSALAPIPEPSTYAALLGVVTLGVVGIRRRRQAAMEI